MNRGQHLTSWDILEHGEMADPVLNFDLTREEAYRKILTNSGWKWPNSWIIPSFCAGRGDGLVSRRIGKRAAYNSLSGITSDASLVGWMPTKFCTSPLHENEGVKHGRSPLSAGLLTPDSRTTPRVSHAPCPSYQLRWSPPALSTLREIF